MFQMYEIRASLSSKTHCQARRSPRRTSSACPAMSWSLPPSVASSLRRTRTRSSASSWSRRQMGPPRPAATPFSATAALWCCQTSTQTEVRMRLSVSNRAASEALPVWPPAASFVEQIPRGVFLLVKGFKCKWSGFPFGECKLQASNLSGECKLEGLQM
jgi:hypothetical protein